MSSFPDKFYELSSRAKLVKLLLTDCDGVLTDAGVYYSEKGEALKRFNIRDGMGVERLRKLAGIDIAIISGEESGALIKRAEKLAITQVLLGVKDKLKTATDFITSRRISYHEVAFIGDDVNDLPLLLAAGLSACPCDAIEEVKRTVHYICENKGGNGAFRDFAEMLIAARTIPP